MVCLRWVGCENGSGLKGMNEQEADQQLDKVIVIFKYLQVMSVVCGGLTRIFPKHASFNIPIVILMIMAG